MSPDELKEKYLKTLTITTEREALEAVKEDGYALRYVKYQTEAICLEAVKRNGYALRYVKIFK